jgi:ATP-dependent DNA helicase RecG
MEYLSALSPEKITDRLLSEAEGQWFDRKSARINPRKLGETLVAMANAEGGTIAIGLHGGACEGVDDRPSAHNAWRQAGIDFTTPPVRYTVSMLPCANRHGDPDHLFIIQVPPSGQVHATKQDVAFLRVGDENRRLTFDQRLELRYDKGDTSYETTLVVGSAPSQLDEGAMTEYAANVRHQNPRRLLQARGLLNDGGMVSVGGQLLFGMEPQLANPQAYVRVLKYAGRERLTGTAQNLISDVRCEGRLSEQIDAAREAMQAAIPKRRSLGPDGRFGWFGIVPEEVWLEGLVNAVIHRSYNNSGDHIRLTVFDDRVEVSSPGSFPGVVSLDDLADVKRFARNPRIARVMSELEYGQELGEGLRRMVAVMESGGRQRPVVQQAEGTTLVTLLGEVVGPRELAGLAMAARDLFQQLSLVGRSGTGELVQLSAYSRPVVLRNLRRLESRGLIRHVGNSPTDPRAYWTTEPFA